MDSIFRILQPNYSKTCDMLDKFYKQNITRDDSFQIDDNTLCKLISRNIPKEAIPFAATNNITLAKIALYCNQESKITIFRVCMLIYILQNVVDINSPTKSLYDAIICFDNLPYNTSLVEWTERSRDQSKFKIDSHAVTITKTLYKILMNTNIKTWDQAKIELDKFKIHDPDPANIALPTQPAPVNIAFPPIVVNKKTYKFKLNVTYYCYCNEKGEYSYLQGDYPVLKTPELENLLNTIELYVNANISKVELKHENLSITVPENILPKTIEQYIAKIKNKLAGSKFQLKYTDFTADPGAAGPSAAPADNITFNVTYSNNEKSPDITVQSNENLEEQLEKIINDSFKEEKTIESIGVIETENQPDLTWNYLCKSNNITFFKKIKEDTGYKIDIQYYLQNRDLSLDRLIVHEKSCERRAEDIFDMTSFAELKIYEFDSYIDVNKHCYLIQTLIRSLFTYYDLKLIKDDLREDDSTKELNEEHIVTILAHYLDTIELDKKLSPSAYAKKYASIYVDPNTFKDLKDPKDPKDFKEDRNNFLTEIEKDIKDNYPELKRYSSWTQKLRYLAIERKQQEMCNAVKTIYKFSANTLFELVGLFGYLCAVDDSFVTAEAEITTANFKIAMSCIEKIIDFADKLKAIPVLSDIFNNIKFGDCTIANILQATTDTCIHGVGYKCMRFYLAFYHYSQLYKDHIMKDALTIREIINDIDMLNANTSAAELQKILAANNQRFTVVTDMLPKLPHDNNNIDMLINQAVLVNDEKSLKLLLGELKVAAKDLEAAVAKAAKDLEAAEAAEAAKAAKAAAYKKVALETIKSELEKERNFNEEIKNSPNIIEIHKVAATIKMYIAQARSHAIEYILNSGSLEQIKQSTQDAIKTIQTEILHPIPLDSPDFVETFENMTQLAPFLIKAPKIVQDNTPIKYLTCSRLDVPDENLIKKPFNIKYLITGFKDLPLKPSDGTHLGILKIEDFETQEPKNIENCYSKYEPLRFYPMSHITRANATVYSKAFDIVLANTYEGKMTVNDTLKKLLSIPATFQRKRIKMFEYYTNYCLNLCKVMSCDYIEDPEASIHGLSEYLKTATYFNIISCSEEKFAPKYFNAIIKKEKLLMITDSLMLPEPKPEGEPEPKPEPKLESLITYKDHILDFTSIAYNADGNSYNPFNPVEKFTTNYHEAQLIAKMLKKPKFENLVFYDPNFSPVNDVNYRNYIKQDFINFCGYSYLIQGQASNFHELLNVGLRINTGEKYLDAINILTINMDDLDKYNTDESYDVQLDLLKNLMQEIIIYLNLILDIEEYKYDSLAKEKTTTAPTNTHTNLIYITDTDYMASIKSMYHVYTKLKAIPDTYVYHGSYLLKNLNGNVMGDSFDYIKNVLIPIWALLVKRMINFVTCNTSNSLFHINYHYKELLDEYYFLKALEKTYTHNNDNQNDNQNVNQENVNNMKDALKLDGPDTESIPVAQEYINKLWLIQKQECKAHVLKDLIDKALKLKSSAIPSAFFEFFSSAKFTNCDNFNTFSNLLAELDESLLL